MTITVDSEACADKDHTSPAMDQEAEAVVTVDVVAMSVETMTKDTLQEEEEVVDGIANLETITVTISVILSLNSRSLTLTVVADTVVVIVVTVVVTKAATSSKIDTTISSKNSKSQ